MENLWDSKWDTNSGNKFNYTGNTNLENNRDSSGSRWADALLGLGQTAMSVSGNNRPAHNFLDINYIGNGLARSSVSPMQNYNYKNPYLLGEFLKNSIRKDKYDEELGNVGDGTQSGGDGNWALSKILGNIGVNNFTNSQYPSSIFDNTWGGDTIYNFQPNQTYPGYLDGGTWGDFGKSVMDYLGDGSNLRSI